MQARLQSIVSSTTQLKALSEELCSINHVKLERLPDQFHSYNNLLTAYKVIDVKYSVLTEAKDDEIDDFDSDECFEIVWSEPNQEHKTKNRIDLALHAQELMLQKEIPSTFNHYPIYRDQSGSTLSEYAREGDLIEFIKTNKNTYTLNEIKYLIAQLIQGLYEYHSNNLTHGDIKPDNLLVFLINDRVVIKYADHDEVIEVTHAGRAVKQNTFYSGTEKYRSPELKGAMLASQNIKDVSIRILLYQSIDWKAADCYALGLTIGNLMKDMLKPELYALIADNSSYLDEESYHLRNLFTGLVANHPENRWTIERAKKSFFFGNDETERFNYFTDIIDKSTYTLEFDGYKFEPPVNTLNNPFYLLDHHAKKVYLESVRIINQLRELNFYLKPELIDYESVAEEYKNLLGSVINFETYSYEAFQSPQHTPFYQLIEKFQSDLNTVMGELQPIVYEKLSPIVLISLDSAIKKYQEMLAKKSPLVCNHIFATASEAQEGNVLRNRIIASSNYMNTYALAYEFIPKEPANYPENSLKYLFSTRISAALPEPLNSLNLAKITIEMGNLNLTT